jgi:bifunctional DNA primase/polymerase-like protein/primase-like protein
LTGGGGQHVFFACPDGTKIANVVAKQMPNPPLGPGVDVRSAGGYVVGASSLHMSGRRYEWDVDFHPADTPLAPAPAWLIERLKRARGAATDPEPLPSDVWWRLTHQPTEEYRDAAAAKIAGHLFAHWCDYQLVLGLLDAWNSAWCKPPLGYRELHDIVDRIAGRQAAKRGWQQ